MQVWIKTLTWIGSLLTIIMLIVVLIKAAIAIDNLMQFIEKETGRVNQSLNILDQGVKDIGESAKKIGSSAGMVSKSIDTNLGKTSETIGKELVSFNSQVETFNKSSSLVAVSAMKVTDKTLEIQTQIQEQFFNCGRNPGCLSSRWMAVSGEAMRTMDSVRRMSDQAEKAMPSFIDKFEKFSESGVLIAEQSAGVAKDIHTITDRYANPSWKTRVVEGAFGAAKVCLMLC